MFVLFVSVSVPEPAKISPVVPVEAKRVEQRLYPVSPQPFQPLPEADDDWLILFDIVGDKPVIIPTGIRSIYVVIKCFSRFMYTSETQPLGYFMCTSYPG